MKLAFGNDGVLRVVLGEREELLLSQAAELCNQISRFAYAGTQDTTDTAASELLDMQATAGIAGDTLGALMFALEGHSK